MMTTAYPFSVSGDEFKGKRFWSQAAPKEWEKLLSAASHSSGAMVATTARSPLQHGQSTSIFVQTTSAPPKAAAGLCDHARVHIEEIPVHGVGRAAAFHLPT